MQLHDLTAAQLSERLRAREVSAVDVVNSAFARIDAVDQQIGAFLTVTRDEALAQAAAIDQARMAGEALHPLAGVPMGIKDNLNTKGVVTTCASRMLERYVPPYDATVVAKMREAGLISLGKLNMDEFAMGSSTENSAFKKTRNPWDLGTVPGGSSGGSAAAVAAGMVPLATGSDTGGSIRQPAAFCGIVGMKPTYGLVSRYGLVAFASSLDQVGPMTRDVRDNALMLGVLAGHDPLDSTSIDQPEEIYANYLTGEVKGMRIGVISELMGDGASPEVRSAVEAATKVFEGLGAVVESVSLPTSKHGIAAYYLVATAEASSNLARYDGVKYTVREEAEDLMQLYLRTRAEAFGTEVKRRIMLGTYALSSGYYDAYYKKAQQVRTKIREDYDRAFAQYDLIIGPTTPSTAFKLGEKTSDPLEMYLSDIATVLANLAGIPALSIPCGFDGKGLPIGLQLQGPALSEGMLYRAAYAFEQATSFHTRRPELLAAK
ncbi:Asp-tRNA(Asn)/Glu-tRNA(Gln) amidotransferase subunit GatA [bacterium]|nr:Asp-tRNA(Asn)/Glu-tRNA(Gln) amidotransferase subunit GatA [bacterium]